MADRKIVHSVANWEDLLTMRDPRAEESSNVTAENPIHIYLNRKALIKTIVASVKAIESNRAAMDTSPAAVADTIHLLDQRRKFLVWLRAQYEDTVYVSLHPQTIYEVIDQVEEAEDKPEAEAEPEDQEPWQE